MRNSARIGAFVIAIVSGLIALGTPTEALAQGAATITGRVTSTFGSPISANVYINDLAITVPTNDQGTFTITVPEARVQGQQVNLRVRAIGYAPEIGRASCRERV